MKDRSKYPIDEVSPGTAMLLSSEDLLRLCDAEAAVQKIDQTTKLIDYLYTEDATGVVFLCELWVRLTTLLLITQGDNWVMTMLNKVIRNQVENQSPSLMTCQ